MALEDRIRRQALARVGDLNRFRDESWMRSGAALPGTVATAINQGVPAAHQFAMQFARPSIHRADPMEIAKLKKQVIDSMADLAKAKEDNTLSLFDKVQKANKAVDMLGEVFKTALSSSASASAQTATARINMAGDLFKGMNEASMRQFEARLYAGLGGDQKAMANRVFQENIAPIIAQMGAGQPIDAQIEAISVHLAGIDAPMVKHALIKKIETAAAQKNVDFRSAVMSTPTQAAGMIASVMSDPAFQSYSQEIDKALISDIGNAGAAMWGAALRQGGGPNVEKAVEATTALRNLLGMDASEVPGAVDELDRVVASLRPPDGTPDAMQKYQDLLDQLDQPNLQPASTLFEARQRLFEDPSFQSVKREMGFATDAATLKFLRQNLRENIRKAKMADAMRMRDIRMGNKPRQSSGVGAGIGDEASLGSGGSPKGLAKIDLDNDVDPKLPKEGTERGFDVDKFLAGEKSKPMSTEDAQRAIDDAVVDFRRPARNNISPEMQKKLDELETAPSFSSQEFADAGSVPFALIPGEDGESTLAIWDEKMGRWFTGDDMLGKEIEPENMTPEERALSEQLDQMAADIEVLPDEVRGQLFTDLTRNYRAIQARGAASIRSKQKKGEARGVGQVIDRTILPGEEMTDGPKPLLRGGLKERLDEATKDGVKLPSLGMMNQALRNALFGLPETIRKAEGAVLEGVRNATDPEQIAIRKAQADLEKVKREREREQRRYSRTL